MNCARATYIQALGRPAIDGYDISYQRDDTKIAFSLTRRNVGVLCESRWIVDDVALVLHYIIEIDHQGAHRRCLCQHGTITYESQQRRSGEAFWRSDHRCVSCLALCR